MEKSGFPSVVKDLDVYNEIVEACCHSLFTSANEELLNETLWNLTEQEKMNFNVLLVPPTSDCLSCDEQQTK